MILHLCGENEHHQSWMLSHVTSISPTSEDPKIIMVVNIQGLYNTHKCKNKFYANEVIKALTNNAIPAAAQRGVPEIMMDLRDIEHFVEKQLNFTIFSPFMRKNNDHPDKQ